MKIGFCGLFVMACLPMVGMADMSNGGPTPTTNVYFGAYGGYHFSSKNADGGATYYGTLGYAPCNYFSFNFQAGQLFPSPPFFSEFQNSTAIELVPHFQLPLRLCIGEYCHTVIPYLSAGAGYYLLTGGQRQSNHSYTNLGISAIDTQETEELDSQVGGIFGGGLDFKFSETYSIGIDVAYIYWRPLLHDSTTSTLYFENGSVTTTTSSDTRLYLDTVRVTIGFKVRI